MIGTKLTIYLSLLSLSLDLASALSITTPIQLLTCGSAPFTIDEGVRPFYLTAHNASNVPVFQELALIAGPTDSPFPIIEWNPIAIAVNTSVFVQVVDSTGATAQTGAIRVDAGTSTDCLTAEHQPAITVEDPSQDVRTCGSVNVVFRGGEGPYNVTAYAAVPPYNEIASIETLTDDTDVEWESVAIAPETSLVFEVRDSTGRFTRTNPFTVQRGTTEECLSDPADGNTGSGNSDNAGTRSGGSQSWNHIFCVVLLVLGFVKAF